MKKSKPIKDIQLEVDKAMSALLGFVDDKQIITIDKSKGIVFIGGQRVLPEKMSNLKSEAEFVLNSDLWKVLSETIRHMAYDIMFTKSKDFEDIKSGKMLLYHLDIQKKLMETLRSYQQPAQPLKRTSVL